MRISLRIDLGAMNRRLRANVAIWGGVAGLLACGLTEPAPFDPQPTIVIELPAGTDSLLNRLNEAHFYITPPGGMTRDTLLRFEPNQPTQRVRVQLRPNETVAGTTIDLELKDFGIVLFTGSVELQGGEDWALSLNVAVGPILQLSFETIIVANPGANRLLSDLAWVSYPDGAAKPDEVIDWSVSNPAAAVISGDRVTFPISGSVALTARWRDQEGLVAVTIR